MKNDEKAKDAYLVEATSSRNLEGSAATEMTGLIASPALSRAQEESYKEIFPYSPDEYVEKKTNPGQCPDCKMD